MAIFRLFVQTCCMDPHNGQLVLIGF